MTNEESFELAKTLLDPILDVMGGADGGVAFVKMRKFIADMAKSPDIGKSTEFITMVTQFSKFSKLCLDGKIK